MQQDNKQTKKKQEFFVALKYIIIVPSSLFQRFFPRLRRRRMTDNLFVRKSYHSSGHPHLTL